MEDSGLFDAPSDEQDAVWVGNTFEQRIDSFAGAAKEATQLVTKLRTNMNSLAQDAHVGEISNAQAHIGRISAMIAELSSKVEGLAEVERSLGLRGPNVDPKVYLRELEARLAKDGVTVTKGPDPYWLVYPAWFTVGQNSKGSLEVVLNGDKLASVRPTEVATKVAEVVKEKFQAKQFMALLVSVRDLLRRAGANNTALALEDVYEVLALEGGKRTSRRKDFTKADFYYSVHRLAEELERAPTSAMDFPASNRSHFIFFTKDGEARKYLTVEFLTAGSR